MCTIERTLAWNNLTTLQGIFLNKITFQKGACEISWCARYFFLYTIHILILGKIVKFCQADPCAQNLN